MLSTALFTLTLFPILALSSQLPVLNNAPVILSSHQISLNDRYANTYVNNVFKDNILLNLDYLSGVVQPPSQIDWSKVEANKTVEFTLKPNETFAYHEGVLPEYEGKITKTTNAHFNGLEGFKSDGLLTGDGVCHLASLINWTAQDAKLMVLAPTNHNFAVIPEIPKEYGTAIYYSPGENSSNQKQNLYITNNRPKPVTFRFEYTNGELTLNILEVN